MGSKRVNALKVGENAKNVEINKIFKQAKNDKKTRIELNKLDSDNGPILRRSERDGRGKKVIVSV